MDMFHGFRATGCVNVVGMIVLFALSGVGCITAPDSPDIELNSKAQSSQLGSVPKIGYINGTHLYSKTLGEDHIVSLYEFGPGVTAIRESLSMDNGENPVVDSMNSFRFLADVYTELNSSAKEIPAVILEADARAAQTAASAVMPNATLPSAEDGFRLSSGPRVETACSADLTNDGWSGNWFLNNYCNTGAFRYCQANFAWVDSGTFSRSWASWRQMEGDFNLPGHIHGDHAFCDRGPFGIGACGWQIITDFEYDVLPRHIEIWTWNSGSSNAHVAGSSQCGHIGVSFLWN
jgi:hypothetical protein